LGRVQNGYGEGLSCLITSYIVDQIVDITDVVCPVTFIKAKVALEELELGQVLSIRMNDGEPVQNMPRSVKEEEHEILKLLDNGDSTWSLIARKA
jgi:TusA-related sulfurtransferase